MITGVPAFRAGLLVAVVLACVVMSAGDPARSKIHFGRSWGPASRRQRQRDFAQRPAPWQRTQRCGRACQRERSKALSPCLQAPRDGGRRCGDEQVRYSYVAASNSCVPFLYGGCRGNTNNFATFEQCRDRCKVAPAAPAIVKVFGASQSPFEAERRQWNPHGSARFRPTAGDNRIHFGIGPRMGGGRRDNSGLSNRFGRPQQEQGIGPRRGPIFFPGPVAQRPASQQPSRPSQRPQRPKNRASCFRTPRQSGFACRDSSIRYSYLRGSNSCVPFEFRGCGGSSNNFATFSECSDLCKTPPPVVGIAPRQGSFAARRCRLPWRAGSCRGFGPLMRYYFNERRSACELALYSGCGGNPNRFFSRRSCERTCMRG